MTAGASQMSFFLLLAAVGGFLPTIFWLWFWLHEDRKKPEPTRLIMKTFIVGGFFIVAAFLLEKLVAPSGNLINQILDAYQNNFSLWLIITAGWPLVAWALIEEFVKYAAAYVAALKNKNFDEPIDAMIYMITAALGFAAVENFLFLLNVLHTDNFALGSFLLTGNLRFLGATLLHTVTSATMGAFLSFSFYRSRRFKFLSGIIGLLTATALHTLFNFFIIVNEGSGVFRVLVVLWMFAMFIIFLFEIVKRLAYARTITKPINQQSYVQ
ncbi:MAG: PrsW family glutamic-type intramembrane protease [Candidatus Paceibacterota bacterium]|jgi:RsiW-degrading membrane proteinase PrsW (M82 family)